MRSSGRIFMALSGLAVVAAVAYAFLAKELAGAVMLGVFSVAPLYIGTVLEHAGPYDRAEGDEQAEPELGPEPMLPATWGPPLTAAAAGCNATRPQVTPRLSGVC